MADEGSGPGDAELFALGVVEAKDGMQIYVSINSWNGGEPKLSLVRRKKRRKSDELWHKAAGRMTEAEVKGVMVLLLGEDGHNLDRAFELARGALDDREEEAEDSDEVQLYPICVDCARKAEKADKNLDLGELMEISSTARCMGCGERTDVRGTVPLP